MKEDLGHWKGVAVGKRPPQGVRNQLDILGLRMGWGNGLGVMGMYLVGSPDGKDLQTVEHLLTRGLWRLALSWGLGELEKQKAREWAGGRDNPATGRQIKERGNWYGEG